MSIEEYLINQIRENLSWLTKNTDVDWDIIQDQRGCHDGIRFQDAYRTIVTIWEDETL